MRQFALAAIGTGSFFVLASLLTATVLSDPHLPIPLAIGGAGLFVGGAILVSHHQNS
jgi:uncharacterized membrane protein YccC